VILLLGFVGKIARYIPIQAVTGFLLLLGALIIFPENAPLAMEDPFVGGVHLGFFELPIVPTFFTSYFFKY